MKLAELKEDHVINEWFDTLNPRPRTRKNYTHSMQHFTEWTGKTPEQLLTEAEQDIRAGKLMRERSIKRDLIGFRKHLQDLKFAPITVKSHMTGIRSFFKCFDIEIPTLPRATNKARPLERNTKIPDKEDIQDVLKVADPLERAVVLVGAASGLAANEIINLKVSQFKEGYDQETEITTLTLRRGKVGYDFVTFLTPEASRAVWDYLEYRERKPKHDRTRRNDQLAKQRVYSDYDYLFIRRQVDNTFLETFNDEERKIGPHSFVKIYTSLSEKAQKSTPAGHWNVIRSHNLRKWFNSVLLNAGADSFFVEFAMGHTLDDTRSAYFRASPAKLREIYAQYIPYLTVQKNLDISESPEYQQIKKENKVLQAETARHVVERSELADMRRELEAQKKRQEDLNTILEKLKENPAILLEALGKVK